MTDEELEEIQSRVGNYEMFVGGFVHSQRRRGVLVGIRRRTV